MSDFTPEQVERAAEALWAIARVHGSSYSKSWEALHECAQRRYRREALTVLSAAGAPEKGLDVPLRGSGGDIIISGQHRRIVEDGSTLPVCDTCINPLGLATRWDHSHPEKPAPVVDEAELADVLWNHLFTLTGRCECGYQAPSMNPRHATDHLASVVAAYLRGESK